MKVFLTSRAFLILSLLWLTTVPSFAFFQNTSAKVKTKYEFTDTRISEADTLLKKREYQLALEAYQKAYAIYDSESFYEGMVYVKERMGRTFRSLGKDSLSKVTYQGAAALSREKLGPNHILESKAYLNNGIRAHRKQRFSNATLFLDSATWAYRRSLFVDSLIYGSLVDYKYYAYFYSGLSNDTLVKYLGERERIYEERGMSDEQRILLFSDYCRAFYSKGDYQKSIAYGIEAVRRSEEFLNTMNPFYYSDALYNLARSLTSQKQYERGLTVIEKLLIFTEERFPKNPELLSYLNLKAITLNGLERYQEAAKEFNLILDRLEQDGNVKSRFYRDAVMNLGVCYELMGNFSESKALLTRALNEEKEFNNSYYDPSFSLRYRYLGKLYSSKEEYHKAVYYYDSALRRIVSYDEGGILDFPEGGNPNMSYETLSILKFKQRNFVDHIQKEAIDSTELIEAAIKYAEFTHDYLMLNRENLQASEGRLFLSQNFKSLYESALIALHLYYEKTRNISAINKARKFFALSKSILFLEQSGELGEIQDSRLSLEKKKQFFELKTEIDELEQRFYRLLDEVSTSDSLRQVNSQLLKLDSELRTFKDSIDQVFGSKRNLKTFNKVKLLPEAEVGPRKALIEFFVGDEYTFVLCVSQNESFFFKIELDEKFDKVYRRLLSRVTEKPQIRNHTENLREYQSDAFFIYQVLLKDILERLDDGIDKLTIVPDEQLAKLPFEALVSDTIISANGFDRLNYLIKRYTIDYSLTSQNDGEQNLRRTASKGIFGIGFSGDVNAELRSDFGALPGTEEELKFLRANFDGDYFLGGNGTRETFMRSARDYDVLHLAVHGSADSSDRYQARLIFNGQDGNNVLKTSDLYLADLRARVAILSACESGVGEINRGEGTFSIARGFALVGVPSVIMSLWKVNDKIAADLMVGLHGNLKDGLYVNEALTKTKRDYLMDADAYTSHPYYWSAFVSLGENVKLNKDEINHWELIFISLVVSIPFIFFILRLKKRKGAV